MCEKNVNIGFEIHVVVNSVHLLIFLSEALRETNHHTAGIPPPIAYFLAQFNVSVTSSCQLATAYRQLSATRSY